MNADSFRPSLEGSGIQRFLWECANVSGGDNATQIILKKRTDRYGVGYDPRSLTHEWNALLDRLAEVEADRDRWQSIATKLADAV